MSLFAQASSAAHTPRTNHTPVVKGDLHTGVGNDVQLKRYVINRSQEKGTTLVSFPYLSHVTINQVLTKEHKMRRGFDTQGRKCSLECERDPISREDN